MRTRSFGPNLQTILQTVTSGNTKAGRNSTLPLQGYHAQLNGVNLPDDGSTVEVANHKYNNIPLSSSGLYGSMVDDVSGVRSAFKLRDCTHSKLEWHVYPGLITSIRETEGFIGVRAETKASFTPSYGDILTSAPSRTITNAEKNAVKAQFNAGDYQDVNLGEFFNELALTRMLFEGVANNVISIMTAGNLGVERVGRGYRFVLQRGANKRPGLLKQNTLKSLNELSLGLKWGVIPMINDIDALMGSLDRLQSFQRNVSRRGDLITRVSSSKTYTSTGNNTNFTPLNGWIGARRHYSWRIAAKYTVTGYYQYPDPLPVSWYNNLDAMAMGHLYGRPLYTAWKVIPFSFVADWFLKIGDALTGLRVPSVYAPTLVGACESSRSETLGYVNVSVEDCPNTLSGWATEDSKNTIDGTSSAFLKRISYARKVITSPTATRVPKPVLPSAGQLASLGQLVYAIASRRR